MPTPNQLGKMREDVEVTAADLLRVPVVSCNREWLLKDCAASKAYTLMA